MFPRALWSALFSGRSSKTGIGNVNPVVQDEPDVAMGVIPDLQQNPVFELVISSCFLIGRTSSTRLLICPQFDHLLFVLKDEQAGSRGFLIPLIQEVIDDLRESVLPKVTDLAQTTNDALLNETYHRLDYITEAAQQVLRGVPQILLQDYESLHPSEVVDAEHKLDAAIRALYDRHKSAESAV